MNATLDTVANVFAGITGVALVAVIVTSPETKGIIGSLFGGYRDALRAATLKG